MPHPAFPHPPNARLLIATGCAHCATVLEGLTRLIKMGHLGRLEIINLAAAPEADRGGGVRTLPLTEIGPFRLEGALSPRELADWAEAAARGEGWPAYLSHLLDQRRFDEALARVRERPAVLAELLGLLADPHTSLATRIGIGALVEDLAGSHALRAAIPQLATLTLSAWPQTRADACHYLGMTGDPAVIPAVRQLLDDDQAEVREIAAETLALLGDVDNPWDEETP